MPDRHPATPLQQVMILDSLRERGSGVHVEQIAFDLAQPVDPDRLRDAWQRIADRNDALRMSFHIDPGTAGVRVEFAPEGLAQVPVELFEWSGASRSGSLGLRSLAARTLWKCLPESSAA